MTNEFTKRELIKAKADAKQLKKAVGEKLDIVCIKTEEDGDSLVTYIKTTDSNIYATNSRSVAKVSDDIADIIEEEGHYVAQVIGKDIGNSKTCICLV